jgi:dihydroflavonol-4-reductase
MNQQMKTVFVTGATGLLGSNLVSLLLKSNFSVRALVRDEIKADRQLAKHKCDCLEIVKGDIRDPSTFSEKLKGIDTVFHTAAYFRDGYKGGKHWPQLYESNVLGTERLLEASYLMGVRKFLHISSIAVIRQEGSKTLSEDDLQIDVSAVDDYYRSKIEADQRLYSFMKQHPDMMAWLVLPGWMHGPGDAGPTAAGQFVLDYMQRKLPGVVDAAFSIVDARDVAAVALAASQTGISGRRYLAAGRALKMYELLAAMEQISGVKAPTRNLPRWLLFVVATVQEAFARLTGKPVLLSLATARNLASDYGRRFSADRIRVEFGLGFRPLQETLADELHWFGANGYLNSSTWRANNDR